MWVIPPEVMRQGASSSGPGICYGYVHTPAGPAVATSDCKNYHCETLRYCDGHEHAQYCTVVGSCDGGVFVPTSLTW